MLSSKCTAKIENQFSFYQKLLPGLRFYLFNASLKGKMSLIVSNNKSTLPANFGTQSKIPYKQGVLTREQASDNPDTHQFFENNLIDSLLGFESSSGSKFYLALSTGGQPARGESIRLLEACANSLIFIIENDALKNTLDASSDYLKKILHEMSVLHEIGRSIESSQNLDALLQLIIEECMRLMNSEAGSLMLVVPETDELEFKVALGPKSDGVKPFRVKMGKGISGWAAQHGESILIPDAYADPRFDPSFDKRSGFKTKSYLCVPLIHKTKTIGVMNVLNRLDDKPFSENDKDLLETFAAQAALAIENNNLLKDVLEKERMEKELQVAAEIQKRIIPEEIPETDKLDIAADYIPCLDVSGDFYDIITLDEDHIVFVTADVAGKGVPGAMLVATMQASLRAYFEYSKDIISIVDKLNRKIIENTTGDRFITFFMGIYNLKENRFQYINAGHNNPIIVQKSNDIVHLDVGGIFLGMMPWQYESAEILLEEGDLLAMFTDGLVEAMDEQEEEFGDERLERLVIHNKNLTSEAIIDLVISKVREHTGEIHLDDDFTLVVVKRK